jgi:peroxiredoxin Q/BCP
MAQLRQDYAAFRERGAEILVVSPEPEEEVRRFWQQEHMPFPGLADPDHTVAELFGQEVSLLRMGRLPALLVVDRNGDIKLTHRGALMTDIPETRDVLAILDELNAADPSSGSELLETR